MKKNLFLTVILFIGSFAQAADNLRIFDAISPVGVKPYMIREFFVVDPSSSHVWVEVEVTGNYWDMNLHRDVITVKRDVAGLSYDLQKKEVLLQSSDRGVVVCGSYEEGGILSVARVVPSGKCTFIEVVEDRRVDDGYHTKPRPFVIIDLLLKKNDR